MYCHFYDGKIPLVTQIFCQKIIHILLPQCNSTGRQKFDRKLQNGWYQLDKILPAYYLRY